MEKGNQHEDRILQLLEDEVKTLQTAAHPNVVNLIQYNANTALKKRDSSPVPVIMIVLELAQGGELFDIIAGTGPFSENMARNYFSQLI